MPTPDSSSEWTSLSITKETSSRLSEFIDAYGGLTTSGGVDQLLSIASDAGIPVSGDQRDGDGVALEEQGVTDIHGFVFEDDNQRLNVIGVDGSQAHLVTALDQDSIGQVQPLGQSQIRSGTIYCPCCAGELLEYELSSLLPSLRSGFFEALSLGCPTCGSSRRQYTLFAAQDGVKPQPAALSKAMKVYFAWLLVLEPTAQSEFEQRIEDCRQLATDGGWSWLPDPSLWIGYQRDNTGPVSPEMYTEFIESYLRLLLTQLDPETDRRFGEPNSLLLETELCAPGESVTNAPEQLNSSDWQVKIEKQGRISDKFQAVVSRLDSGWSGAQLHTGSVPASGFADDAVVVSLTQLSESG